MDVFATRTLSYKDDTDAVNELVFTVFRPFEVEGDWKCLHTFEPPAFRWNLEPSGVDFLQAFVSSLAIASTLLKTSDLYGRLHWQGMTDCGLPESTDASIPWGSVDIPSASGTAGDMAVLATRSLGCPDESGRERAVLLTVFVPFKEGEAWKCGIAFDPALSGGVYFGVGEDLIEALLDGLALARAIYEREVPEGWTPEELYSCSDFPYKIGRSFRKDPPPEVPGMPERSAE